MKKENFQTEFIEQKNPSLNNMYNFGKYYDKEHKTEKKFSDNFDSKKEHLDSLSKNLNELRCMVEISEKLHQNIKQNVKLLEFDLNKRDTVLPATSKNGKELPWTEYLFIRFTFVIVKSHKEVVHVEANIKQDYDYSKGEDIGSFQKCKIKIRCTKFKIQFGKMEITSFNMNFIPFNDQRSLEKQLEETSWDIDETIKSTTHSIDLILGKKFKKKSLYKSMNKNFQSLFPNKKIEMTQLENEEEETYDEIESEEEMKYDYDDPNDLDYGPNESESDEEIELPIESIRFPHFDKESEEGKKYSKNKKEYFEKKEKLLEEGKIIKGKWISFNNGKVLKMAGDYNEARSHFEFPKYVFVIRVDHEQDVPNLKSKRRYTHQIDSIDKPQKLFSVKANWKFHDQSSLSLESIVGTGAERSCLPVEVLPKSIKDSYEQPEVIRIQIEGTKEKYRILADIQEKEDWGNDQIPSVLIGNEGFIDKHHITFHGYDTDEKSGSMTFHNLTEKKDGEKSEDSPTFEKDGFQSSSDDEVVENPQKKLKKE
jgi:hypothetical protein